MNSTAWTPTPRRRIYLMRHGDVRYFDADGRPVRPDTVPLTDEGRRQAEAAARELAAVPLDRVLSSDLGRCIETATIVTAGRGLTIEPRPDLREIQPGRLTDLTPAGAEQAFLGAFAAIGRDTRFLGGETFGSLLDRVTKCWNGLLSDNSWQHLLIVAHGGVNRAILTQSLGVGLAGFGALEQDPCCLNIVDVADDGRCLVRLINHTAYDPAKAELRLTTMETLYRHYVGRTDRPPVSS